MVPSAAGFLRLRPWETVPKLSARKNKVITPIYFGCTNAAQKSSDWRHVDWSNRLPERPGQALPGGAESLQALYA